VRIIPSFSKESERGEVFFNSLSYFCSREEGSVRGDRNEGTSRYQPSGGLLGNLNAPPVAPHGLSLISRHEPGLHFLGDRPLVLGDHDMGFRPKSMCGRFARISAARRSLV
jgi:hypothetical protein